MYQKRKVRYKKADVSDESEGEETKDAGFLLDPDQIFDELPQPYRLIDKTLNHLFDKAWDAIEELKIKRYELGVSGKIPLFHCTRKISECFQPTLICSTSDGRYTFVATRNGAIYAVDVRTSSVVATNRELQGLLVLSLSASCFGENKYFVCTLQDNGLAAIFALSNGNLHLLQVFNEESGVKNSVTTYIKISFDGNYIGVGWKVPVKSSWVDIYKVPKEFWINEIEIADEKAKKLGQEVPIKNEETPKNSGNTLQNDSSDSEDESINLRKTSPIQNGTQIGFVADTSFTKPILILRVRSPDDVAPNPANNASSALKVVDPENNVIGTGTNHILLQQYFDHSYAVFKLLHQRHLQYIPDKEEDDLTRTPTLHFVTPGRLIPAGSENAPDIERKPDEVFPTSSKVVVSDVSVCKTMISWGLKNNNIVTWDILRGVPLNVVKLTASGTILSLHFLPTIKASHTNQMSASAVKLLACSGHGGIDMVEYGEESEATINNLSPSSYKTKDLVVQITHIPNFPKLVIVQRKSGVIAIVDIFTKLLKCRIGLVKPYTMLGGFCYAEETSTLFMKGGQKDEYEEILPESVSIFTINLETLPVLKCYYEEKVNAPCGISRMNFDKRIEEMTKDRIRAQEKRQRHRSNRWRQFEAELKRMKKSTIGKSVWLNGTVEA